MLDMAGILVLAFAGWMICDRRKRAHFAAIPELLRSLGRGTRSTTQFILASIGWGLGATGAMLLIGSVAGLGGLWLPLLLLAGAGLTTVLLVWICPNAFNEPIR